MDESELTEEQLFKRCGTKLTEEKVEQILEQFKENGEKRSPIIGTPEIDSFVHGYKILGYLGTGGFGTVCLATKEDYYFAIKFMHVKTTQRGPDEEYKFLNKVLRSKEHESFLTALEWNEWKDGDGDERIKEDGKRLCYMVMKMVGPSLQMLAEQQKQKENTYFPICRGVPIMQNALKAIQMLHEKKRFHPDIKLENFAIDLCNESRIFLLDFGMGCRSQRQKQDKNGFKGTRLYASRRALQGERQSYRDDYESWLYCLYRFLYGELTNVRIADPLEQKRKFWSPGNVKNLHVLKIMKHIDLLNFNEKMNYDFVQQCLQDLIDEDNYVPELYKVNRVNVMQIVKGNLTFNAKDEKKKPIIRLVCSAYLCNFTVFVETSEYEKAEENSPALIVNTKNQHNCSTV